MKPKIGIFISFALLLTACAPAPGAPSETPIPTQVETPMPTGTATAAPTETPLPKKFTQEDLDQMTPEQKIAAAPEINDLTKSNVSETKPNLIVYRDDNGTAQMTFDLTTAKELTLPEAGIVDFDLTDGTHWDVPAFYPEETPEIDPETGNVLPSNVINEVVDFMIKDGVDWGNLGNETLSTESEGNHNFVERIKKIPNRRPLGGFMIPSNETIKPENRFSIEHKSLLYKGENVTLLVYIHNEDHVRRLVYVHMPVNEVIALLVLY